MLRTGFKIGRTALRAASDVHAVSRGGIGRRVAWRAARSLARRVRARRRRR